ncbi:MAG: hypothetical protein EOP53_21505 [Sphingobacteriales bacterium]|nr:MAG: hypothetical protein EOP53_21505 [Sphingobacteriales bacterium]
MPYWFHFKDHVVFETEIKLPENKQAGELPSALNVKQANYSFKGTYQKQADKLLYKCEIILNKAEVKPEHFSQWNKDIKELNNFYSQQVVLTQK